MSCLYIVRCSMRFIIPPDICGLFCLCMIEGLIRYLDDFSFNIVFTSCVVSLVFSSSFWRRSCFIFSCTDWYFKYNKFIFSGLPFITKTIFCQNHKNVTKRMKCVRIQKHDEDKNGKSPQQINTETCALFYLIAGIISVNLIECNRTWQWQKMMNVKSQDLQYIKSEQ